MSSSSDVILSSPRPSAADPQITPGYRHRRTVPTEPLLAAVVAALGYVSKLAVEQWRSWRVRRAEDIGKLLALRALLGGSGLVFRIQRISSNALLICSDRITLTT